MTRKSNLFYKIYGSLAGVAIGDAFGTPGLFSYQETQMHYSEITSFTKPSSLHLSHFGLEAGEVTDDTFQTYAIADAIIDAGSVEEQTIISYLRKWYQSASERQKQLTGPSFSKAMTDAANGVDLNKNENTNYTNGAAMRISPIGWLHLNSETKEIVRDVYKASSFSHGTNLAISGASAIACAVSNALSEQATIESVIKAGKDGADVGKQFGVKWYCPSISRRIDLAVEISPPGKPRQEVIRDLYDYLGAWISMEQCIPSVFGLFYWAQADPMKTIIAATNMGGDADTIASMVGSLCGAFSGIDAFPPEHIDMIEQVNHLELKLLSERFYYRFYPAAEQD